MVLWPQGIGVYFPKAEICRNVEEFITIATRKLVKGGNRRNLSA
jgi:hypothetical protein